MRNCTNCKYRENMCKWPCDDCVKGDKWEEKPFTNADHIRAMTDEMLAYYITMLIDRTECILKNKGHCLDIVPCQGTWLDWLKWLKQEADNDKC